MSHCVKTYRSLREDVRDILGAHTDLQQKNDLLYIELSRYKGELDRLTADVEQSKAEVTTLRSAHQRLEADYKSLLGALEKHGIFRGSASRRKTKTSDTA
ncbi:hypothetical protein PsorP6_013816 [Peronosclerospora sorghi]|uniref:Uncharacterized protein n=1 Tax=Peronosclerospora sorghi TaxID=230839 RepID=A0ACC0VIC0_9STRA|nr:hypothetical protein PsorP6_013816 [Peronosclerospora sorghi]